jgi:anaerobic ribonucleoside-triphosphate reductase activating protein
MQLSRVHYPVLSLGFGLRAGIWTQGCSLRCAGCVAQDTWDSDPATDVAVEEIMTWLRGCPHLDGVTISGGEPFDQPGDLVLLLQAMRDFLPATADILCYTGRTRRAVQKAFPEILDLIDLLAAGPFSRDCPTSHPLLGSANQELCLLTALAKDRYGDAATQRPAPVQVSMADGRVWTVGIPRPGDLDTLERSAAQHGVALVNPSWKGSTP